MDSKYYTKISSNQTQDVFKQSNVYPIFPQKKRQSLIVSHHTYDKCENNESKESIEFKSSTFKDFTLAPKNFYTPDVEFTLSDSEYGSLKNEKGFNHSKTSIVRKICDSTTDIPSNKHLKENSPEPKISTTCHAFKNVIQNNSCESSSDLTPNYMQENRSIPFKKRYIHSFNLKLKETDNLIMKPPNLNVSNNRNSSNTDLSYTSSSALSQSNDNTQFEDPTESISKVKSWNADFETAYNNDYTEFNPEHCAKLAEKINEAKIQYENNVRKSKGHYSKIGSNLVKRNNSEKDKNHFLVYNGFSVRMSEQHLKTLNICSEQMSADNQQGCSFQSITCGAQNQNKHSLELSRNVKKFKPNDFSTYSEISSSKRKKIKFAETPLSPETTKRNEFYSYLQLNVKPQYRSDGTPIEPSRRSVRVKNIEINKERDRSISEEIIKPDVEHKKIIENSIKKIDIKKLFAKPKLNQQKKENSTKMIKRKLLRNDMKKKTKYSSIIQTRRSMNNSINLRSNRKYVKLIEHSKKSLKSDKNSNTLKKLDSKMDENILNEIGFSLMDKQTSLKSETMLMLARNEIDKSLEQLNHLKIFVSKNDETEKDKKDDLTDEKKVDKKVTVKKKPKDEAPSILNHINGPVTRHSFAVIHKTLTRGSHTKIPKLNLDAVMKRMYNKHKTGTKFIAPKIRYKPCSIPQNIEPNIESSLENISLRRENVSNLLNAVNSEVLKVQNNILELSSQNSCYDFMSECSKVSEHSFRGFGIPLNGGGTTSSSGTTSESYSEASLLQNQKYEILPHKRRYSLPTYVSNELELKLNEFISSDLPGVENIEIPTVCINDSLVCHPTPEQTEDLIDSSMKTDESSPKFIPLSPHPVRPFHQIFNKRVQKQHSNLPCIFGNESTVQFANLCSQEWSMFNSSGMYTNPEYIPILRQTIQDKLNIKQNKIIMPQINKSEQHVIDISSVDGQVLSVHFLNSTLMIVQDKYISFWQQTPLGSMLGAQNMWLSLGKIQRLKVEIGYINIRCVSQCCLSSDNATAYVEIWAKEHKSERRERPITDVFAAVYFHQQTKKGNILEKKVIQLENTKSFAQDVQFVCLKYGRSIIISWRDQFASPPISQIRRYQLAIDFQTISNVMEMESVEHYINALHDVKDCFEMILGIGDHQVSVWHLLQGKLVTTVTINNPLPVQEQINGSQFYDINCVWALCDRGFLFLLNKTEHNVLHLIAIHGLRKDWKNLQMYRIPPDHTEIQSVGINGGVLLACSKKGIVCWSLQSGAMLLQCPTGSNISLYPSGTHISLIDQHLNVGIKNVFAFLLED